MLSLRATDTTAPPTPQVKVDSEEHVRKAGGRLRWVQLRRWLEKRVGGSETLTLRCVNPCLVDREARATWSGRRLAPVDHDGLSNVMRVKHTNGLSEIFGSCSSLAVYDDLTALLQRTNCTANLLPTTAVPSLS